MCAAFTTVSEADLQSSILEGTAVVTSRGRLHADTLEVNLHHHIETLHGQNCRSADSKIMFLSKNHCMLEPLCHPLQRVTGVAIIA